MISSPDPHQPVPRASDPRLAELQERWRARFGPRVAMELEPDRRYSVVRIGSSEYAFRDHGRYVRVLRDAWSGGFVPEPLPSAMGRELLDVAPNLRAVDPDPEDVGLSSGGSGLS